MLEILYRDDDLIAINKPHGLLVHKSPIAADASEFAVQLLRDQIGMKVFPVHRLDRKTAGVLLFALNTETNQLLQKAFMERQVNKSYLAFVRGYTAVEGAIDYALTDEKGRTKEALTRFKTLQQFELGLPSGKFSTARYSLVEVNPETGRMHQIRKHFAHIFHPIIGDRPHGCNKQNKLFLDHFDMNTMLLHAEKLSFIHPYSGEMIEISAKIQSEFQRILNLFEQPIL
ncbi:MAG: pseudouridine synthase [Bacteroidota bacterium]